MQDEFMNRKFYHCYQFGQLGLGFNIVNGCLTSLLVEQLVGKTKASPMPLVSSLFPTVFSSPL